MNRPIHLINISRVMFNISVNTRKVHFSRIQRSAAVLPNIKCWQFGFNSNPPPCNEDLGRTQYKLLPLRRFFSIFADADGDFVLFLWSLLVLQIGKLSSYEIRPNLYSFKFCIFSQEMINLRLQLLGKKWNVSNLALIETYYTLLTFERSLLQLQCWKSL